MTDANQPLVTIGVPVRNGEQSLTRALESALGQTYRNVEVVVSDNCSTDGSAAILTEAAARDERVRTVRQPTPLTMMGNHAAVWRAARGEYFMWLQHDDHLSPDFVERALAALVETPAAVLVYGDQWVFSDFEEMSDLLFLPRSFDTRGLSILRRLWRDRDSGWEVKGLMRTRDLDGYRWWEHTLSPDWPLLTHFLVLGDVIQVPGIAVYSAFDANLKTPSDRARLQSYRQLERFPALTMSWRTALAASDAAACRGSRRFVLFDFLVTITGLVWRQRGRALVQRPLGRIGRATARRNQPCGTRSRNTAPFDASSS